MPSFPTHPAMRSGLDAQLGFLTEFTRHTADSLRKLNELHLQFAQQVMQDVTDTSRAMLNCTDPMQAAAVVARSAMPVTEHVRNYQQQLMNVLNGVQLELSRSIESLVPQDEATAGTAYRSAALNRPAPAERHAHAGNGAHYTPS